MTRCATRGCERDTVPLGKRCGPCTLAYELGATIADLGVLP